MTGNAALRAYGYVTLGAGLYVVLHRKTQRWQEAIGGGWWRFEADGRQCPYRVDPEADAISLNMEEPSHAQYFDWVWPDEEIVRIYAPENDALLKVGG